MGHQVYNYDTVETPSFKKWWVKQNPYLWGAEKVLIKLHGISEEVTKKDVNSFILKATNDVEENGEESSFMDLENPPAYSVVAYNLGPSKDNPENNVYVYSFDVRDEGQNPWNDPDEFVDEEDEDWEDDY